MENKNYEENVSEIKGMADESAFYLASDMSVKNEEIINIEESENIDSESKNEVEETIVLEHEQEKPVRVNEIPELRGENSKVFRMSDGSEQAVFYSECMHVFDDETQSFVNVNNTLQLSEDGKDIVGGKNSFSAKFSRDEANDELFRVYDKKHSVTVSKIRNSKQKRAAALPILTTRNVQFVDEMTTESENMLVFKDAEDGADYTYSLNGNGVKEDIIINNKADEYRYSFLIHCEGLGAEFDEEKRRVSFTDAENGKEIFYIPSPFMTDANNEISSNVVYDVKESDSGNILLTVTADSEWINAEERAFPVVIDPQIKVSGTSAMETYSWTGGNMSSASTHTVGTNGSNNASRMYIKLKWPTLPRNPRIKNVELKFFQLSGSTECTDCPKLALYQVKEINTGTCTPTESSDLIDYNSMKAGHCEDGQVISYTFDITNLADAVYKGEKSYLNLVLKMLDETSSHKDKIVLYGSSYGGSYAPQVVVTYESSYGVNTSYRTHSHELGRFGQGSIDLACGNLMFESEDFAWSGNRMPVSIKHMYNSAIGAYQYTANSGIKLSTANFSAMNIGCGYKLNIMQSMVSTSFQHEGKAYIGYVYIGENGEETYFCESEKKTCCSSNSQCYKLYESVDGGDMVYDPEKRTMTSGSDTYQFDGSGRLVRITDENNNSMAISYISGQIKSVTDGAGRVFNFSYSGNNLIRITAPDESKVEYTYTGNLLSSVEYPDGKKVMLEYSSNLPSTVTLLDNEIIVYKVKYEFNNNRVTKVSEYGSDSLIGASSSYSYYTAARRTVVSTTEKKDTGEAEDNVINTVYTFDKDGNTVSEYVYTEETGNVGGNGEASGINPYSGEGGAGVVSNINNLLVNHNFKDLEGWTSMPTNCGDTEISDFAAETFSKYGGHMLRIHSHNSAGVRNGVYQTTNVLPAGEYTFSSYVEVYYPFSGSESAGAYIRVVTTNGTVLGESEHLKAKDDDFIRLIVPFKIDTAQSVKVEILADGAGVMHANAAQLENNQYANAYNMLENGNFERDTNGWTTSSGAETSTAVKFNMSKSLKLTGNISRRRYAYQKIVPKTSRSTRETFTLSGWAEGYGLVDRKREYAQLPTFRLRAVIKYSDNSVDPQPYIAQFSPCTEGWQFASVQFSKSDYKKIKDITVYCDYDYNFGNAYFDDIQLVRNSIETGLSASDFVVESTSEGETDDEEVVVKDNSPTFNEVKDKFGNALTETTFTDGEFGTIYRSFEFNGGTSDAAGNNLIGETDARGNKTSYTVDNSTSRNKEVVDRLGNKTAYEYDESGRTTKVTSKKANGTEIANVSYSYDAFDNMTEIARGDGMKYVLAYNSFHNLESIGVNGKADKLIKYTYKNGNGRLKEMTYANGDKMSATYNSIGQMIGETWKNSNNVEIAHYKYVYDGQGNIVRSIDILNKKEYNYEYDEGKIVRATESDIIITNDIVTTKTLVNTIKYYYDTEGKMIKKVILPANGEKHTVYYENNDDNTVVKFKIGDRTVTSHSKSDSFGRKEFDELQLGTGFVSRQFSYCSGEVTDEHKANAKLKSTATTQLVNQIVFSDGRTISYEYDAEERITKVTDSIDGVTEYTYDALGQLLTEKVNGVVVNNMTYDNYGNIKSKNGVAYTYGDGIWKDLLTKVGEQTISYDKQGNPTSYLGHNLTWEKGRQLKSFDSNTYTYNANGIRTSKTVGTVKHTYMLNGINIMREEWSNHVLVPLYDNIDSVCGIIYDNNPYYFIKNLQGDIIAIADVDGNTVAKYSYDAWGVCTVTSDTSSSGIATINPFRYRGYYFDLETNLYYLQSRYYNPAIGRFVNADDEYIFNVTCYGPGVMCFYNYCSNNPVNGADENGNWFITAIKTVIAATKMVHDVVSGSVKAYMTAKCSGYTSLQTTLSVLLSAGIAVVKNVIEYFINKLSGFFNKVKKALRNLLDLICAFLNEFGSQWIALGDFHKVDLLRCLRVVARGVAFNFVNLGLEKYRDVILTKLMEGLINAKFAKDVIYEIYVILFVDLPQNVINALI